MYLRLGYVKQLKCFNFLGKHFSWNLQTQLAFLPKKKFRIVQICRKSEPYNSWKCFQIIRAQNIKNSYQKLKRAKTVWENDIYIYTYIYLIEVDSGHLSRLVQPGTGHQRTRQSLRREWRSLEPEVCYYRPSNRKSDHEYGLACLSVFSFEFFLVSILLIYIDDERRALVKYSSWGHV